MGINRSLMSRQNLAERARLVVVTGGANGIGEGTVRRLAKDGYHVLFCDVDTPKGETVAAELTRAGLVAEFVSCDVSRPQHVSNMSQRASTIGPALYAIVNNAGIFPRRPFLELSIEEWERVIATNLTGTFLVARTLVPLMIPQHDGVIINMASGLSFRGDPLGTHYASSKHGIRGFTKSLALALGPQGIRVNAIAPGATETAQALQASSREELIERGHALPLGRIGQPSDVANVISFLLGPDARYITGQTLLVNGGADMP